MDSFQLGILALALLCTGTSPFIVNNEKDPRYKLVSQGEFETLFNILPAKQKPSGSLKDLISSLIKASPEARRDVKDVENTEWWQSTKI